MNITNEIVGLFLAVTGAIWGSYKWIENRILRVENKADKALAEVAAHREHVAKNYPTHDVVREVREEIRMGFKGVTDRIDRQNERLDRVIDKQGAGDG